MKLQTLSNKAKDLKLFFKEPYLHWVLFWLFIISFIFTCIVWNYGDSFKDVITDLYRQNHKLTLFLGLISFLILSGIFIFAVNPVRQLKRQQIHNQPSWVFYSYWGAVNTFILYSIILFIYEVRNSWWGGYWWTLLLVSLLIIAINWISIRVGEKIDLAFKRFASGSAGVKDDKLDFNSSAKNVAKGLSGLKGYVNVVGLYGGLGFGKSSYARMILENFDKEQTLYTYISLTETNEAKDFSKLFAERWLDTLSERYPKIDVTSYLPFMDSILRESGNGLLSEALKIISILNRGLARTKALFFDEFYDKKRHIFSTYPVAKLFGNITIIKESVWVIMVDEIERAQFDEIYRLVEIIERFKNEGRSGLPVKLLFIFCISEPDLTNYLNTFSDSDTRARLLKTFFYEDPKSIAHRIFLPSVSPANKEAYVLDLLNKVIQREGLEKDVPKNVSPNSIADPTRSFMDHKDAAEYTIGILKESSPRIINRIVTALDFFYGAYRNRAGELQKSAIRFNDIVALEYIKIKYPFLINFFVRTIHLLINQAEVHNLDAYFAKEKLEENKWDLIGWIEAVTDQKILDSEKPNVLKMVGLVMYYYFDFLDKNYQVRSKDKYFGTTSYPEIMADYLSLMDEGTETNYRKNNRLYQNHKSNSKDFLFTLDNKEFLSYTRFIFEVPTSDININIDLIDELSNRIINKKIEVDAINVESTGLDESIYQLVFQIVAITEKERKSNTPTENIKKSFQALKSVLSSSNVPTGVKFIALSSLVNNERGGGSAIHSRLNQAFRKLQEYYNKEISTLIKFVFRESEQRYLKGKQVRSLYKYEENFFYTLYQGWSGINSISEIKTIRSAAKRDLKKYPEAIKLYWRKYPYEKGWKDLDDVFEGDRFFSMQDTNNPLYMPLETLISITKEAKIKDEEILAKMKFWESLKNNSKLKDLSIIKEDSTTLRSYMIRNGFIDPEKVKVRKKKTVNKLKDEKTGKNDPQL